MKKSPILISIFMATAIVVILLVILDQGQTETPDVSLEENSQDYDELSNQPDQKNDLEGDSEKNQENSLHARLSDSTSEHLFSEATEEHSSNPDDSNNQLLDTIWENQDSIGGVIETLSSEKNWSLEEKLRNSILWAEACKSVDSLIDTPLSAAELMEISAILGYQKQMFDVCQGFHIDFEIQMLDQLLILAGDSKRNLRQELRSYGEEKALDLAVEMIFELLKEVMNLKYLKWPNL